jgi:FixJ family two-component response regulator
VVASVRYAAQPWVSGREIGLRKKPVISIVDDDKAVRKALTDFVKSLGFEGKPYPGANEFLKSTGRQSRSCLIADVQMPVMTGLKLHDRLVESGDVIPTILITALPNDGDRKLALRSGVTCYLVKPFNDYDLLACFRSALESRKAGGRTL